MSKATYIGHWPGKSTRVCDLHKIQMQNVAQAMGIPPIFFQKIQEDDTNTVCENCRNDPKTNSSI